MKVYLFLFMVIVGVYLYMDHNGSLERRYQQKMAENRLATWKAGMRDYLIETGWKELVVEEALVVSKIDTADWSYPWYIIKHGAGKFENTLGEKISEKDTIKLMHNAKCSTFVTNESFGEAHPISRLPFAKSTKIGDQLKINIYDQSASNNEALFLVVEDDLFNIKYHTEYVFSYDSLYFSYHNKYLKLNQKGPYPYGSILKGELMLELTETMFRNGKYRSKNKRIAGSFEVEVKKE